MSNGVPLFSVSFCLSAKFLPSRPFNLHLTPRHLHFMFDQLNTCVTRRVRWFSVHLPSRPVMRLTGRRNATKNQDGGQILWFLSMTTADWFFEVKYLQFPEVWFYSISEHNSMLSITFGLAVCHPASCVDAILSNSKTTSVCSTRMLKTTEKRKIRLGVRVLL